MSGLQIEYVDPATLKPDEANPRAISEDALQRLAKLLDSHGWVDPAICRREDNLVIGGHQRIKANALRAKPDKKIPCVFLEGVSDGRAKALNVGLNNQLAAGAFSMPKLANLLQDIDTGEFDVPQFTGFSDEDLAGLMHGLDEHEVTEDEAPPLQDDAISQTGDLWLMGGNRLLCGDCTGADEFLRLVGEAEVELLFTSPPYLGQREYGGNDLSLLSLLKFIPLAASKCSLLVWNLGVSRKDGAIDPYWDEYTAEAAAAGLKMVGWNVWDRGSPGSIGQQTAMFPLRHEFIFAFAAEPFELNGVVPNKTGGQKFTARIRSADGKLGATRTGVKRKFRPLDSVVSLPRVEDNADHPAQFPVALPAMYIKSIDGDVYEPFSGSGTTIIACEQLKRKCYAIEICPQYCDVAVQRWQKLTGKDATLDGDGRTFAEIEAERRAK